MATEMEGTQQANEMTTRIKPENISHAKNTALHLALIDTLIRLEWMCLMSRLSNEYLSPFYLQLLLHCMVRKDRHEYTVKSIDIGTLTKLLLQVSTSIYMYNIIKLSVECKPLAVV